MKRLMIGVAAAALMASTAMAQSPSSSTSSPPAASPSPSQSSSSSTASTPAASSKEMITTQKPDQWTASSFKGTDVLGSDDKKIGDISDILFTKEGKIDAYVVAVGGFMGMGAKEIALPPTAFQVTPGDKSKGEADKLKISMTQDELKNAQNFARYEPPKPTSTTGAGPGGASRPAGGGAPMGNR